MTTIARHTAYRGKDEEERDEKLVCLVALDDLLLSVDQEEQAGRRRLTTTTTTMSTLPRGNGGVGASTIMSPSRNLWTEEQAQRERAGERRSR